jgi:hypothetical protein
MHDGREETICAPGHAILVTKEGAEKLLGEGRKVRVNRYAVGTRIGGKNKNRGVRKKDYIKVQFARSYGKKTVAGTIAGCPDGYDAHHVRETWWDNRDIECLPHAEHTKETFGSRLTRKVAA